MSKVATLDHHLANHSAKIASQAQVVAGLSARLVFIDYPSGEDNYHVLQCLKDTDASRRRDPHCYYLFQRWGVAGFQGFMQLDGPLHKAEVATEFAEVFKDLTDSEWGSVKPGESGKPGKYWLQQQTTPDSAAKWEYHVNEEEAGRKSGWYPFDKSASAAIEDIFSQHVANKYEARTAHRIVRAGFKIFVFDFFTMMQHSLQSGTQRSFRRSGGQPIGGRRPSSGIRCQGGQRRRQSKRLDVKVMKMAPKKAVSEKKTKLKASLKGQTQKCRSVQKAEKASTRTSGRSPSAVKRCTHGKLDARSNSLRKRRRSAFEGIEKGKTFYMKGKTAMDAAAGFDW